MKISDKLSYAVIIGSMIVVCINNELTMWTSLVIIAVCLYVIDKHAYTSDSKWKYFTEYNTERQYIIDNPSKGSYVFKDKVKEQEYRLIVEKHILEGKILSAKDLDDVVANLSNRTFRNIFSNIYPYGRDYKLSGLLVLCILLGIPCLLYYIKKGGCRG